MVLATIPKCEKCGYAQETMTATGKPICPKCNDLPEGDFRYDYTPNGTKFMLAFSKKYGYCVRTRFEVFPCSSFQQAQVLFYILGFFPIKQWHLVIPLAKKIERQLRRRKSIDWAMVDIDTFANMVLTEVEKRLNIQNG